MLRSHDLAAAAPSLRRMGKGPIPWCDSQYGLSRAKVSPGRDVDTGMMASQKTEGAIVHVVDDDASVRRSLGRLFYSVGIETSTYDAASAFLAARLPDKPGCIVLDIRLPDMNGLDFQVQLVQMGVLLPVVMMTGHGDIPMGIQAMKSGAVDFLPKPISDAVLLEAVARALARSAQHWRVHDELAQIRARIAGLTPREYEVFRFVIAGLLNKQIAGELGSALRTIKTHRGRVMHKLGVESVAELVRLAQKAGVTPAHSSP